MLNPAIRSVCGTVPHRSTVIRWTTKGVLDRAGKRVKLRTTRIGGRHYTHPEWVSAFVESISEPVEPASIAFRSETQRKRDAASAKCELDKILG